MSNNFAQNFLDMMVELARSNPELKITDHLLYAQLVSFRLGISIIPFENVEKYFRDWITFFQANPLIEVYRDKSNPFICRFVSKKELPAGKGNIKIYVPLDSIHIKNGVIDLFDFMSHENIAHNSKVLSSIRNDNVIIRVSTIEDVNKIVKYIKNNTNILAGLLNSNPFLIPCYKLGVIIDNNFTYNIEITKVLASLLEELRAKEQLDKFTTSYVKHVFDKLSIKCSDDELSDIYKLAALALDDKTNLQDFANYIIEYQETSYTNKHGSNEVSYNSSVDYFNAAILETFKRYNNLSFVINAIKLYLTTGNVKGFTRINQARKNLSLYCDKDVLKKLFEMDNLDFSIKYYALKVVTEAPAY